MKNMFLCHRWRDITDFLSVQLLLKMTNQLKKSAGILFDEFALTIIIRLTKNLNLLKKNKQL
jgi:hypothetical protein